MPAEEERQGRLHGILYVIKPRTPLPGIGWEIPRELRGRNCPVSSQGAFYDDMAPCEPDFTQRPPDAYDAAEESVRLHIDKLRRKAIGRDK